MSVSITEDLNKKSKNIIDTLVDLALESSIHGLPRIIKKEKIFLKLMWLIFFLVSTIFGVYFSFSAVIGFLNYDVALQIDFVKEIPTQFPTVSFFFNDEKADKNYSLDQRLISCTFNARECNFTDFEDLTLEYGGYRYFKFNSGKDYYRNITELKKSKLAGSDYGLSMQLFIGLPDDFNKNTGFSVYIHNYTFDPIITSQQPIYVSPGTMTNLKVERQFNIKLEKPYNECKSNLLNPNDYDSFIYKYMASSSSSNRYNQNDCYDLCQAKYIIDNCNKLMNLSYTWLLKSTNDTKFLECLNNKQEEFFDKDVTEYCSPFCPLECNTIKYDISFKSMQYPSKNYALELANNSKIRSFFPKGYNITQDDLKQSILFLNIYYDDLSYTVITESPKILIVNLVSNIGGILGLFVGISFLSFGELFEMFFEIIFIICEKKTQKIRG